MTLRSIWQVLMFLSVVLLKSGLSIARPVASETRTMVATRTDRPPRIDGRLDDLCWEDGQPTSDFILKEPEEGAPAEAQTVVRILYDEEHLYLGLEMFDDRPDKIEARVVPRDGTFYPKDLIGIVLDTYHDHQSAYGFWINPYGIQNDFTTQDDGANGWWGTNTTWNGVWMSEAQITDRGWTAEVAIPFRTLRFPTKREQTWGINIQRNRKTGREESYWSPITQDEEVLQVSKAGHLTGLRNLHQGLHLELLPYTVAGYREDRDASDPHAWEHEIGLDIKYGITSNLTLDLTLNPDFAQIESDEDQINLSRFEMWTEERRPFFIEGKDLFTSMGLFYSRRVQNPDVGAKLTGKAGSYNLGLMTTKDSPQDTSGTVYSVFRLKRDILSNSSIGILGVDKQIAGRYHRATGIDLHLNLGEQYEMNGEVARSFNWGVRKPSWKYHLSGGRESDGSDLWAWLWGFDPEFDVDEIGFSPHDEHVGERGGGVWTGASPRIGRYGIKKVGIGQGIDMSKRTDDDRFAWDWFKEAWIDWENHAYIWGDQSTYLMRWEGRSYRGQRFWLGGGAGGEGFYRLRLEGGVADRYDFDDEYFGSIRRTSGRIELNPLENLSFRIRVSSVWEYLPSGAFDERKQLGSLRLTYLPTRDLFLRGFLQINPTDDRGDLNLLLSYTHRPGSHLYLAYTESREDEAGALKTTYRALMMKFSYLWNL